MLRKSQLTIEDGLYLLVLILAGLLRFGNLGGLPLSEAEAAQALTALAASQGATGEPWTNLSYVLPTSLLFSFFVSNEFLARFWPALAGSVLVLLPYGLRDVLGKRVALVAALGLAVAPGFVAFSRTASADMIGLSALCFALLAWRSGSALVSGLLAGLALVSGANVYVGFAILLLVWALATVFKQSPSFPQHANFWQPFSFGLAATLGVFALMVLRVPQALSGAGVGLAAFFAEWLGGPAFPLPHIPLWVLAYASPALVFGLAGVFLAWRRVDSKLLLLALAGLAALLFLLLYPGRAAADMLWLELPLWMLAAAALVNILSNIQSDWMASLGAAGLILLLGIFTTIRFSGISSLSSGDPLYSPTLILGAIVLALGLLATLLIGLGWSPRVATSGLAIGLAALSLAFMLAGDVRQGRGALQANELFSDSPQAGQTQLLLETVNDLSIWQGGQARNLPVRYQADSRALAWALCDWPDARFDPALGKSEGPAIIISLEADGEPEQTTSYRGQRFIWGVEKSWACCWPPNLFGWLLFREAPMTSADLVFWAREDLFPANSQGDVINEDLETDSGDSGAFGAE